MFTIKELNKEISAQLLQAFEREQSFSREAIVLAVLDDHVDENTSGDLVVMARYAITDLLRKAINSTKVSQLRTRTQVSLEGFTMIQAFYSFISPDGESEIAVPVTQMTREQFLQKIEEANSKIRGHSLHVQELIYVAARLGIVLYPQHDLPLEE